MSKDFCVTKQVQWPDGDRVVELNTGGFEYCNPGAIGSIEEFYFATEAAERAIEVADKWSQKTGEEIPVAYGYTYGGTMPFDPCEKAELLEWAKKQDEALPSCDQCGKKIPKGKDSYTLYDEDATFCSEYCAEEYQQQNYSCDQCGEPVGEKPFHVQHESEVFCSEACYDEFHKENDSEEE